MLSTRIVVINWGKTETWLKDYVDFSEKREEEVPISYQEERRGGHCWPAAVRDCGEDATLYQKGFSPRWSSRCGKTGAREKNCQSGQQAFWYDQGWYETMRKYSTGTFLLTISLFSDNQTQHLLRAGERDQSGPLPGRVYDSCWQGRVTRGNRWYRMFSQMWHLLSSGTRECWIHVRYYLSINKIHHIKLKTCCHSLQPRGK